VDPDPYSEDEGVRVHALGCAGRHLRLHAHPCSRRGMTGYGPGHGFGSGLDPDSIRSVDLDPYSEDEGVRVCALGCAGRHLRLHVHPCSRRGMTNDQFYLIADPEPGSQTNADPDLAQPFK
jgi:hypothetical protein